MNSEPLRRLDLNHEASVLPPDEDAPQIGRALAAGLRGALAEGRTFKLRRRESGLFRAENVDNGFPLTPSADDELLGALAGTAPHHPSAEQERAAGIPVGDEECASAGLLLLRLFRESARLGVWLSLDYRAGIAPHLRYRLVFRGAGQVAWRYLRSNTLIGLLIKGLAFLATDPVVL
jgi:hypothetical protein